MSLQLRQRLTYQLRIDSEISEGSESFSQSFSLLHGPIDLEKDVSTLVEYL